MRVSIAKLVSHRSAISGEMAKMSIDRQEYADRRKRHWDEVARRLDRWRGWGGYYHSRLRCIFQFIVPPGVRVLEVGCAEGNLLAALKPSVGVGVDLSPEMVKRARAKHPGIAFMEGDIHALSLDQEFDFVILSDVLNDLWDVQAALARIMHYCTPRSRIVINNYSRLWGPVLGLAARVGLATPVLPQNWLTLEDTMGLLSLANFEVIRTWQEVIWPLGTPVIAPILNRFAAKLWPFRYLALTNFVIARPMPKATPSSGEPTVSVVIPACDEEGNIPAIFERVPEMGGGTELIFVEGHSKDNTYGVVVREIAGHPERPSRLYRQIGRGKADAVRLGFANAKGEILMILDADLTVPPEGLTYFYEAISSGKGEFVNGVRLVYPMDEDAMRFFNLVGNKSFGLAFSWLLGQKIKDTLCGTKVLWKSDYEALAAQRSYFGDFDPFGDFDLLFGAVKQNLKIVDLPVRYGARTYGRSNIHRWRDGLLLLRMMLFAARRIKFI